MSLPNSNHKVFISKESNIETLVGVATLPLSFPPSGKLPRHQCIYLVNLLYDFINSLTPLWSFFKSRDCRAVTICLPQLLQCAKFAIAPALVKNTVWKELISFLDMKTIFNSNLVCLVLFLILKRYSMPTYWPKILSLSNLYDWIWPMFDPFWPPNCRRCLRTAPY